MKNKSELTSDRQLIIFLNHQYSMYNSKNVKRLLIKRRKTNLIRH